MTTNLKTEAEASNSWCPFVRQRSVHADGAAMNRSSDGQLVGGCVGARCMAWREVEGAEPDARGVPTRGMGYCGLAGRP